MSYDKATLTRLRQESAQIMGRYPSGHERSALIPMLHLIQSYDGYVSPDGIRFCAETLNLTTSEVSAVAVQRGELPREIRVDINHQIAAGAEFLQRQAV